LIDVDCSSSEGPQLMVGLDLKRRTNINRPSLSPTGHRRERKHFIPLSIPITITQLFRLANRQD
jgi:hypothetical protein